MKQKWAWLFLIAISFNSVIALSATARVEDENYRIAPILKTSAESSTSKWRIGYFEGRKTEYHQHTLIALIQGLMAIRWIESKAIPKQYETFTETGSQELWAWINANLHSDYIEFVPDAFWSPEITAEETGKSKSLRLKLKQTVLTRLTVQQDIDLMLAMGVEAGQDLANDEHSVATVVAAVSDAVKAKIVSDYKRSNRRHIIAKVNPYRVNQQIRVFHDVMSFEKLGIAYENTEQGRSFGEIAQIEALSKELGFELVKCYFRNLSEKTALDSGINCYEFLADNADAVYITHHPQVTTLEHLPILLRPLERNRIVTFAQTGSKAVKQGVLMSIAEARYIYIGKYYAETIAKIFNGATPWRLPQIFTDPPKIAINLKTAERIGYDPPIQLLGAADEIYQ